MAENHLGRTSHNNGVICCTQGIVASMEDGREDHEGGEPHLRKLGFELRREVNEQVRSSLRPSYSALIPRCAATTICTGRASG